MLWAAVGSMTSVVRCSKTRYWGCYDVCRNCLPDKNNTYSKSLKWGICPTKRKQQAISNPKSHLSEAKQQLVRWPWASPRSSRASWPGDSAPIREPSMGVTMGHQTAVHELPIFINQWGCVFKMRKSSGDIQQIGTWSLIIWGPVSWDVASGCSGWNGPTEKGETVDQVNRNFIGFRKPRSRSFERMCGFYWVLLYSFRISHEFHPSKSSKLGPAQARRTRLGRWFWLPTSVDLQGTLPSAAGEGWVIWSLATARFFEHGAAKRPFQWRKWCSKPCDLSQYPPFSGIPNFKCTKDLPFRCLGPFFKFPQPMASDDLSNPPGRRPPHTTSEARNVWGKRDETQDERDERDLSSHFHDLMIHLKLSCAHFCVKIMCKWGFPSFNKHPKNQVSTLSLNISVTSHLSISALATLALSSMQKPSAKPWNPKKRIIGSFQSWKNVVLAMKMFGANHSNPIPIRPQKNTLIQASAGRTSTFSKVRGLKDVSMNITYMIHIRCFGM